MRSGVPVEVASSAPLFVVKDIALNPNRPYPTAISIKEYISKGLVQNT